MGSIMGSEITAAVISDKIGQVRRDPFAMLSFIGYHVGDYLQHWLDIGEKTDAISCRSFVNWFRKDDSGNGCGRVSREQPRAQVGRRACMRNRKAMKTPPA